MVRESEKNNKNQPKLHDDENETPKRKFNTKNNKITDEKIRGNRSLSRNVRSLAMNNESSVELAKIRNRLEQSNIASMTYNASSKDLNNENSSSTSSSPEIAEVLVR